MSYFLITWGDKGEQQIEGPIPKARVTSWIKGATEDVKTEYLPMFHSTVEDACSSRLEYAYRNRAHAVVVVGRVVVPKPVTVVTEYDFDEQDED